MLPSLSDLISDWLLSRRFTKWKIKDGLDKTIPPRTKFVRCVSPPLVVKYDKEYEDVDSEFGDFYVYDASITISNTDMLKSGMLNLDAADPEFLNKLERAIQSEELLCHVIEIFVMVVNVITLVFSAYALFLIGMFMGKIADCIDIVWNFIKFHKGSMRL